MLSPDTEERCLFSAKVDNVGTVASLLKAVAFSEKVNLFITPSGLKFTVEEGKYVQASILMPNELFQEFSMLEEGTDIKIPLKELLDCLKIFCSEGKANDTTMSNLSHTSLKLLHREEGGPFEMLLEENGVLTDFQLKTEEIDDLMQFEIDPVKCKVVMKAEHFSDLLGEIDGNGPEVIEIQVDPKDQTVNICGKGVSGLMVVCVPANSDMVELFECGSEICKARYRFNIVKYAFKALQIGEKVHLKMNADGILSLSFLLPSKADSFVEFFCVPLYGKDEEDGLD